MTLLVQLVEVLPRRPNDQKDPDRPQELLAVASISIALGFF
jgi:hypothetical protein